jgi:hypothetical protein
MEADYADGAAFAELPGAAMKSSTYTGIRKDLVDSLTAREVLEIYFSPALNTFSQPGETEGDFKIRMAHAAREQRDKAVDDVRNKHVKALKVQQDRVSKAMERLEAQKSQVNSARLATAMRVGTSLLGAFLGGKSGVKSVASATTVTGVTRAFQQSQQVSTAENELDRVKEDLVLVESKIESEIEAVKEKFDPHLLALEKVRLTPLKKNVTPRAVGILWLPYEDVRGDLRPCWRTRF